MIMINEKQFKRAKEIINKANNRIKKNEDLIVEINHYINKAENNYDYQTVNKLKNNKHRLKQNIRKMKQHKKTLMFYIADFDKIDKSTENAVSNIPVIREYLQGNYQVSNMFKEVTLNSINDKLPVRLSNKTLSKIILEIFPEVESRRITNDIKYNLEMI